MELELEESKVDEATIKEHGTVNFNKRSYSVDKSSKRSPSKIIIGNISQDANGTYTGLSFEFAKPVDVGYVSPLNPRKILLIDSVPSGAKVLFDGEPKGNTPQKIDIEMDRKTHSIRLELEGYEALEMQYNFDITEIKENLTKYI